jgi:threonine dehydrogenase-like Zn-dependent dehydrogenase
MWGTVLYGPRDARSEDRSDPTIVEPTDAVSRPSAACVCGSDLWPYRGFDPITEPMPMGHEYIGTAEEVSRLPERHPEHGLRVADFKACDQP